MGSRVLFSLSMIAVSALGATRVSAQGIGGTWNVTWDSDLRVDGEKVTVNKRSKGKLVLEQRGDSVFATFTSDGPAEARQLAGTFDGKTLKLTTGTTRGSVRINGKPTDMTMRTDWMGAVVPSGMQGSMFIQMGDRPATPRKWEATR